MKENPYFKKMSIKVSVIFVRENQKAYMFTVWPCNKRSQVTVLFY